MSVPFTAEQQAAIEHAGGLLLTANAGSGKTSVMTERFVLAARSEGGDVARILAITFTEKAAAELKTRVRARFEQLGDDERARATEGAWISTIHSFCARLLRTHALAAGIDPRFAVLDERGAERLASAAFDAALDALADEHGRAALALIAAYRPNELRAAIVDLHGELRSRGEEEPSLPPARPAPLGPARSALALARAQAAAELEVARDGKTVARAREVVAACAALLDRPLDPPPAHGEVAALALPRNGAALAGPGCAAYRTALDAYADACADVAAVPVHGLIDSLLRAFSHRYAEAKQAASALDFEDLELRANRLLREHEPLRARYAERFQHVMVDEFQDTNPLQLELLERIAGERLFAVGDELQSIYGFRHADVRQFRARRTALAERGATATLATNFRSHRELLDAFNFAFAPRFDASFVPLVAGREEPGEVSAREPTAPRVELLVTDSAADWPEAGLVPPGTVPPAPLWRIAEAKLLAARVRALLDAGRTPGDVVLLLRATGDLAVYERALVELGVPTYVIGGRGYWAQQQVRDLTAYLSALANPRDGTALMTLLASPLVGLSSDALVQLAAATRAGGERRDSWWTLTGDETLPGRLSEADRERVHELRSWLPHERRTAVRYSLETLLDRVLARTGYDLTLLRMEGGARRMANVRKLMRLAREHEAQHGRDLRGFVDLVGRLVASATDPRASEDRESEAPVEGEALNAVRLMTIHRAKGLEFPVVCVADLGRESPSAGRDIVRVGRDGRVGIRLKALDGSRPRGALAFRALGDERLRAEAEEEARLFYVAMTRAREHLILSGAARCETWPEARPGAAPLTWIGPAFVPDIAKRIAPNAEARTVASHDEVEVSVTIARPAVLAELRAPSRSGQAGLRAGPGLAPPSRAHTALSGGARASSSPPGRSLSPPSMPDRPPPVQALSYTSLQQHAQCGYRFYLERVLALPPTDEPLRGVAGRRESVDLDPRVRGRLVHSLLERLDLSKPDPPAAKAVIAEAARAGARLADADAREISGLVAGFLGSDLRTRMAGLRDLRREQPFSLRLETGEGTIPLVGVLDAVGREGERVVVVDYKSDRVGSTADLDALVSHGYGIQRAAYALAALCDGATEVEVIHAFLQRPDQPASATFRPQDVAALSADLAARAVAIFARDFPVAPNPGPRICDGCPGRGSLCSWPLERTLDVAEGRLF
jgi:ATP-dependent exoDNAse (exonuclease V) beta subunit